MSYNPNPVSPITREAPAAYINGGIARVDGTTAKVGAFNLLASNPTHARIIERCNDSNPEVAEKALEELKSKLVFTFKMANGSSSAKVDF